MDGWKWQFHTVKVNNAKESLGWRSCIYSVIVVCHPQKSLSFNFRFTTQMHTHTNTTLCGATINPKIHFAFVWRHTKGATSSYIISQRERERERVRIITIQGRYEHSAVICVCVLKRDEDFLPHVFYPSRRRSFAFCAVKTVRDDVCYIITPSFAWTTTFKVWKLKTWRLFCNSWMDYIIAQLFSSRNWVIFGKMNKKKESLIKSKPVLELIQNLKNCWCKCKWRLMTKRWWWQKGEF